MPHITITLIINATHSRSLRGLVTICFSLRCCCYRSQRRASWSHSHLAFAVRFSGFHAGTNTDARLRMFKLFCSFLQERIRGVKSLFRDASQTEFIIATIPTQLGIAESKRLLAALQEETIPCKRIIVNQVRGRNLLNQARVLKKRCCTVKTITDLPCCRCELRSLW